MKFKEFIESDGLKKGIGIASALVMAGVAFANALSDQKKAQEFEDLKKAVAELQNK